MKRITFLVLLVFGCTLVFAQKAPVKFGKIDEDLVRLTTHPLDTSADAIVLTDYGNLRFDYSTSEGFKYQFERITRIKVLSKEGLAYGDFEISYYVNPGQREKVHSLKGFTYNMVNGKLEESKLSKNSIYDEETSEHWRQVKVTFPDVEVGSVIELTYQISSPFLWNLNTWEFQNEIPTVYSEYRAKIPEYFDYQLLQSGYHLLDVNERGTTTGMITYQTKERTGNYTSKTEFQNTKIDYRVDTYRWVANNVPPFIPESFVASPSDYILKMEFELKGTQFPNQPYKAYMGTWSSLNKTYVESSRFMKAVDQTGYMKHGLDAISQMDTEAEKINALVKHIKTNVAWNGTYAKYIDTNLRQAWNDKSGSTSEVNLMLVAGLRKLGFKSDPVLISTRGHGMIREQFAISSQFNSVIAIVETAEGTVLLDATDPYLPGYAIPVKCLNGKGWRVSETSWGFVDLNPRAKNENTYQGIFKISEDGSVEGDITKVAKGYSAFSAMKNYKQKGEESYVESIRTNNPSWDLIEYDFPEENGSTGSFKSKYNIILNENLIASADKIYFNPTMGELLSENPFKLKKREYPVDYAQPLTDSYYFTYTLPAGYVVDEMPESVALGLPGKAGSFRYNISVNGNVVTVVALMKISKVKFVSTEYEILKAFYDQAVAKCAEQIILKRTT